MTWVPGTTPLHDLGLISSLAGQQLSHLNDGELGWALQIPAGNEANLDVHALISTSWLCTDAEHVRVMGSGSTDMSKTQTSSLPALVGLTF